MSNIATTISQSRKLIELGLDPKTADMVWMCNKWLYSIKDNILNKNDFHEQDTLAWSLSALLEVMPKSLIYNGKKHILRLQYEEGVAPFMYYVVAQGELKGRLVRFNNGRCVPDAYDALDAAYQLITWLLEDGYIKKGGQDETAE